MKKNAAKARGAATAVLVAALVFSGVPASANPDMSTDFQSITDWLSKQLAQGLGFNAGESFDPPHEVLDKRLQPDVSLGMGAVPLNKSQFPAMQTAQMQELNASGIFPASVNFPNLVVHLRGGLPGRMDFAVRAADMTTPPNYKLSPGVTASGQSNSIGFGVRKHFLGGDNPLVSVGANFNHLYGVFHYNTSFMVNNVEGFTANFPIQGAIVWNLNSYGVNAVVSQRFGAFIPFFGLGESYVTGSIHTHLEADPQTDLIGPIIGDSSARPASDQSRVIFGSECDHNWVNLFFNGEIKPYGTGAGKSWIVQAGMALPFHIGTGSGSSYASSTKQYKYGRPGDDFMPMTRADAAPVAARRAKKEKDTAYPAASTARKEMFTGTPQTSAASPTLIFIQ